jgi:CRP/FNR family transcriptional regulator, cyclic AMP receptor protein
MITPEEMKEIAFLRNLGEQHPNQIASLAQLKEFEEGTIVFGQDQASRFIYFVLKGKISLRREEPEGEAVEVSTLGPGELLGWSPVLGRLAMTATARAASHCRLAALEANKIVDLCDRDSRFGVAFLRQLAGVLSDRLWSTRRNLVRVLNHRQLNGANVEGSD